LFVLSFVDRSCAVLLAVGCGCWWLLLLLLLLLLEAAARVASVCHAGVTAVFL